MTRNLLMVEGADDKRVVPELLERAGVAWGPPREEVVRIHAVDGYTNFTAEELRSQLKGAVDRLGILVDADEDPLGRWTSLRSRLAEWFPQVPVAPPPDGLVMEVAPGALRINPRLRRFGVWMMPDNHARGMLETFLLTLRTTNNPELLAHVEAATNEARAIGERNGAPDVYKPAHRDKALVHTWLAWHGDPPGRQLHDAMRARLFDPTSPSAAPFVSWFKDVFELR